MFTGVLTTDEMINKHGSIALAAASILNLMGTLIAGKGMIDTFGPDPLDRVFGAFGLFEETIATVAVGYGIFSSSEAIYLLLESRNER